MWKKTSRKRKNVNECHGILFLYSDKKTRTSKIQWRPEWCTRAFEPYSHAFEQDASIIFSVELLCLRIVRYTNCNAAIFAFFFCFVFSLLSISIRSYIARVIMSTEQRERKKGKSRLHYEIVNIR